MTDVLLKQTNDGGDIIVEGGVVALSGGLETAVYLSLFGGNEDDDGRADNPLQWWGNFSEQDAARQQRSETQHLLQSLPAIPANLRRVEDAAKRDLAWMLTNGAAKTVEVAAGMPALNTIELTVTINGDQSLTYAENWKAEL